MYFVHIQEFPIDDDNFRDELDPLDGEETGGEIELIERPSVGDFDIEITTGEEDQLSSESFWIYIFLSITSDGIL